MLPAIFVLALGLGRSPEAAPQVADSPQAPAAEPAQTPTEAPAGPDAPAEAKEPPAPSQTGLRALRRGLVGDIKHLPAKENLYLALVGGALAAGVHPVDRTFNVHLRSHYSAVNAAFAPAKYIGDTLEQAAMSLGTYAYGRIFHESKVSHLGMDLLRVQVITEMLVQSIKFATRRDRPDGSDHWAFPSGHAAVTFADATVLERHLGWRRSFLAYAVATYVAASRLHDNRHYLSDVAFGAAVGMIAGRTVTKHGRDNWTLIPVNVPGGVAVLAMRTGF